MLASPTMLSPTSSSLGDSTSLNSSGTFDIFDQGFGCGSPLSCAKTVPVLDIDEDKCYEVPLAFLPGVHRDASNLKVCRRFAQTGICNHTGCHGVHIPIGVLQRCLVSQIHTNYAWNSLLEVTIPRHAPGATLHVSRPKHADEAQPIPSEYVLVTRGSQKQLKTMQTSPSAKPPCVPICAHYYIGRFCRLGSTCNFIHYASVEPGSQQGQRAKNRKLPNVTPNVTPQAPKPLCGIFAPPVPLNNVPAVYFHHNPYPAWKLYDD